MISNKDPYSTGFFKSLVDRIVQIVIIWKFLYLGFFSTFISTFFLPSCFTFSYLFLSNWVLNSFFFLLQLYQGNSSCSWNLNIYFPDKWFVYTPKSPIYRPIDSIRFKFKQCTNNPILSEHHGLGLVSEIGINLDMSIWYVHRIRLTHNRQSIINDFIYKFLSKLMLIEKNSNWELLTNLVDLS